MAKEEKTNKKEVNLAYLFGICVEKGSELDSNKPNRQYKYRVVFQVNRVVNQGGKLLPLRILEVRPLLWRALVPATCLGSHLGTISRLPMQSRHTFKPSSLARRRGFVCRRKLVLARNGKTFISQSFD